MILKRGILYEFNDNKGSKVTESKTKKESYKLLTNSPKPLTKIYLLPL